MNPSGTKVYTSQGTTINKGDLSSAFNMGTITQTNITSSDFTLFRTMGWLDNGNKFWGATTNEVRIYSLSTAYDISTYSI